MRLARRRPLPERRSGGDPWERQLVARLVEAGVAPGEAHRLGIEASDEAASAGCAPGELYGPAVAYAHALARALREAECSREPSPHPDSTPCDGARSATPPHPAGSANRSEPRPRPVAHLPRPAPARRPPRETGPVVLRLNGVTKRYGRRPTLSGVDLCLRAGEVAAVVGANGSGKTTLLNICAGLVRPTSGTIERTASVGYAPQQGGVAPWLTASEHFALFGAAHGMRRREAISSGLDLARALGWTPREGATAGRLSGGTRQKLNVALAALRNPDLILLDEPYQGFDQGSYLDFWDLAISWRDAGAGVLVVTHMLHDLDRADHVLELHTPEESR